MRQIEALEHVAHNKGEMYIHSGWGGRKYLYCGEHSTTIPMSMLDRLLVRDDLEMVENAMMAGNSVVLTEQGKARLLAYISH